MSYPSAATAAGLLACLTLSAIAQEPIEPPMREPLYVCGAGPTSGDGFLKLTAELGADGYHYTNLQFRGEVPGERPIVFPATPAPGQGNFYFSNTDGPDGYLVSIRFSQNGVKYRLYTAAIPPGPNDGGSGSEGLIITEADGRERRIDCNERAYEFIVYMQQAMSCDTDPRYGAAFCDPYNVQARLPDDPLP